MRDLLKRVTMRKQKQAEPTPPSAKEETRSQARHLLHLLGEGGAPAARPPSDVTMRNLAAELVARIEGQKPPLGGSSASNKGKTDPTSWGQAAHQPETGRDRQGTVSQTDKVRLFRAPPASQQPSKDDGKDRAAQGERQSRQSLDQRQTETQPEINSVSLIDLMKQAEATGTLAQEHPGIIASALRGRSRKDQAAALRKMPPSVARAVHRLLIT